jgi:chemotaxis protein MotB
MFIDDDPPPSVPEWTVTFADLMALLLTFFVMLLSMSEFKNSSKFRNVAESMERRFGQGEGKEEFVRNPRTAEAVAAARSRRALLLDGGSSVPQAETVHR